MDSLVIHVLHFIFHRDGHVSLQEYMAFMISRETENVQSSSDVEQAFRALTSGDKPYITAQELYAVCHFTFYKRQKITMHCVIV